MAIDTVFLSAVDCGIEVKVGLSLGGGEIGYTADELAEIFQKHDINFDTDTVYNTSSMDFATEEGFDNDDGAHDLLDSAIEAYLAK